MFCFHIFKSLQLLPEQNTENIFNEPTNKSEFTITGKTFPRKSNLSSKWVAYKMHLKVAFFFFYNRRLHCPSSTSYSASLFEGL